jgi:hypothetical protein
MSPSPKLTLFRHSNERFNLTQSLRQVIIWLPASDRNGAKLAAAENLF